MNDKISVFNLHHLLRSSPARPQLAPKARFAERQGGPGHTMPVEPNWAWDPAVGHPLIHAQEAPANEDSDENTALAPLSFSAYLWRGPFTAHVHCCIPAYAGMAIGDRITVRWGDEKFDLSPLYSGDVGRAVLAAVPTHALEPIRAGDRLELSYCALGAHGHRTGWARPCLLEAREAGPGALYVHSPG